MHSYIQKTYIYIYLYFHHGTAGIHFKAIQLLKPHDHLQKSSKIWRGQDGSGRKLNKFKWKCACTQVAINPLKPELGDVLIAPIMTPIMTGGKTLLQQSLAGSASMGYVRSQKRRGKHSSNLSVVRQTLATSWRSWSRQCRSEQCSAN